MSFLKRLFGGGGDGSSNEPAKPDAELEYKGYTIRAFPQAEGGQFRLAGTIHKDTPEGDVREHRLIRADMFMNREEAANATIAKGKQMVDQQGDRMFE